MSYILSIVVPTKDRYEYLEHLVELFISIDSNEIELVIQDNSKDNISFAKYINMLNNKNIKYYNNKNWLSVRDNGDLATMHSTGEYVCRIGDDDGVLPSIIDCVKWMKKNSIDALVPEIVQYYWPDYIKFNTKIQYSSTLILNSEGIYSGKAKVIDPIDSLYDLLSNGCLDRGNIPLAYHGIVSRKALDKIYNRGCTFSPGPSPDMAGGVSLCFSVEKYVRLDYPIIISGASKMHGGGVRKIRGMISDIDEVSFLPKNSKINWEPTLPKIWCGETVWPESAIKALKYMGHEELIEKINFDKILFSFIISHPQYYKMAINVSKNKVKFILKFIYLFTKKFYKSFERKIRKMIFNEPVISGKKITGLKNIIDVKDYLIKYYNNINPTF